MLSSIMKTLDLGDVRDGVLFLFLYVLLFIDVFECDFYISHTPVSKIAHSCFLHKSTL